MVDNELGHIWSVRGLAPRIWTCLTNLQDYTGSWALLVIEVI